VSDRQRSAPFVLAYLGSTQGPRCFQKGTEVPQGTLGGCLSAQCPVLLLSCWQAQVQKLVSVCRGGAACSQLLVAFLPEIQP
jgi:hypothetical protein